MYSKHCFIFPPNIHAGLFERKQQQRNVNVKLFICFALWISNRRKLVSMLRESSRENETKLTNDTEQNITKMPRVSIRNFAFSSKKEKNVRDESYSILPFDSLFV